MEVLKAREMFACCRAKEGVEGLTEKGGMGEGDGVVKEREGNRWYATLQGTSAAMGGGEWSGVQINGNGRRQFFSPHSASRDDREGKLDVYTCVWKLHLCA